MTVQYGGWDWFQKAGLDASSNPVTDSSGAPAVNIIAKDAATTQTKHDRFIDSITATWPGDDTFAVTWTSSEAVTRYRILVTGGADGAYVKVAEDAVNEAQAEAWLATASGSSTADVQYRIVHTSTPDANGSFTPLWSEWQEFPEGEYLSRLDFLGSAAGPFSIWIEAE